jgi:hypothetical protein
MTADDLLAGLKNRAALPPFQLVWTDANILKAMQEEIESQVVPILYSVQQDYFTDSIDIPLVANQQGYRLPSRAMGDVIRGIYWVDVTGIVAKPPLLRVNIDEVSDFTTTAATIPKAFFLVYDQINILPTPSTSVSGSLRLFYLRRPGIMVNNTLNALAQSLQVGIISAISDPTITLTGATSGWPAGQLLDIIGAVPPFPLWGRDLFCATAPAASTLLTFGTGSTAITSITFNSATNVATYNFAALPAGFAILTTMKLVASGTTGGTNDGTFPVTGSTATSISVGNPSGAAQVGAAGNAFIQMFSGMNAVAGDYVTLAQNTYVSQIPREWHSYIEVRTSAFILESLGDLVGADRFYKLSDEMRTNLMKLVTSRTPGNPLKLNPWK